MANKLKFDAHTGQTTGIVLHLVHAWTGKPEDEAPKCGATEYHHGYRTAASLDEASGVAKRDGVILCGACVLATCDGHR